jgi:hypothetical protein
VNIGKISIRPTTHYLKYHSDVEWVFVIATILSPSKTQPNRMRGRDRFTYNKEYKKFIIETHTKNDAIRVINTFRNLK